MQAIPEPFNLAKVDVYKQLQRRMTTGLTPVMELEAEDGASAGRGAAVPNAAEYFVTVPLGELLPGVRAEAPAPRAARLAGAGEGVSPHLARVDAEVRERLFGRRRVSVRRLALARQQAAPRAVTRRSLLGRKLLFVSPLTEDQGGLSERSRESPTCSGSSRRRTACPFAEACILRTAGLCQPADRGRVPRPR